MSIRSFLQLPIVLAKSNSNRKSCLTLAYWNTIVVKAKVPGVMQDFKFLAAPVSVRTAVVGNYPLPKTNMEPLKLPYTIYCSANGGP